VRKSSAVDKRSRYGNLLLEAFELADARQVYTLNPVCSIIPFEVKGL
jgi:hypothetical protein